MFDRNAKDTGGSGVKPRVASPIDLAPLVEGQTLEAVAQRLPQVFGLAAKAEDIAACLALGLPVSADAQVGLVRDVLEEHLLALFIRWPAHLNLPGQTMPDLNDPKAILRALFGRDMAPRNESEWGTFRGSDAGVAAVFSAIGSRFEPGEASTTALPIVSDETALDKTAQENSAAGRHVDHPALAAIEASAGRGPVWRAFGRVIDCLACLEGTLPSPRFAGETALVHATRGQYAMRARTHDGVVDSIERTTPTDHLSASGGVMEQSFAGLRAGNEQAASLLIEILDPSRPVGLEPQFS